MLGASLFVFPGLGDTVRTPQWLWASLGGLVLAAAHLPFFRPVDWRAMAGKLPASAWALLAFLVARAALGPDPARAAMVLFFPLSVFFGALLVLASPQRRPTLAQLEGTIALVTLLQILLGFLQVIGADPIFTRAHVSGLDGRLPAGFLGQHTLHGLLMAWLAWLWLARRRYVLAIFSVAAVCATKSAVAMAALAAGFLWLAWCRGWRRTSVGLAVVAVAAGLFLILYGEDHPGFFSHNGRLHVWIYSLNAIAEKPWLGYGVGEFSREFPAYHQVLNDMRWEEAHNELIEYVFNVGLLGLLALLPVAFTLAWKLWRLPPSREKELAGGTLLMIGVNAMGNFPLQIAPFAALVIYAVAWVLTSSEA